MTTREETDTAVTPSSEMTATTEQNDVAPAPDHASTSAAMSGAVIPPARGDDSLYAVDHAYRTPMATEIGVGFLVGGGLTNFTDATTRALTNLGAGWDARFILGTRRWLGLEAAYVGSVNNLNAQGLSGDTKLLGTGVQGLARINFTTTALQPYIVGGAGWKHYALSGDKFNVSGVRNSDNVAEIPMGFGIAFHQGGFMLDARGMYNYTINSALFAPPGVGSGGARLHNWGARANMGFEF